MRDLRLSFREPIQLDVLLALFGAHAVPGLETYADGTYTRVIRAPGGPALIRLSASADAVHCGLRLSHPGDREPVVAAVRGLLDLDTDPAEIDAVLDSDPALAPLVAKRPGLRSPGAVDAFETAIRTIVGQQISVSGARTVLGRIVADYGEVAFPGEPWRLFPAADALAAVDPTALPMPRARARAVVGVAAAFARGAVPLQHEAARKTDRAALLALPGIGPWTADYLLMRVARNPDVLLASDLGVRRAAADLGIDLGDGRPDWSPWRSYATYHLWAYLYADLWSVTS